MRSASKIAALALLVVFVLGCGRKTRRVVPPPVAQAPSLPPGQMADSIPPVPPHVTADNNPPVVKLDTVPPETETAANPAPRHRPTKHRSKSAAPETAQQPAAKAPASPQPQPQSPTSDTEVATGKQPSEDSPIGQLSTSNDSANTADRHTLVDLINSIETGLNAIRRPLNSEEQKTATQVRTFITRAREALKVDDLDGAHTLATKAHLLLQELTKE
jgi:outer membrane biosynthesis protein TonB